MSERRKTERTIEPGNGVRGADFWKAGRASEHEGGEFGQTATRHEHDPDQPR